MAKPTDLPAWGALHAHYRDIAEIPMRQLFADDPNRFATFSRRWDDFLFDYSKNRITAETRSRQWMASSR